MPAPLVPLALVALGAYIFSQSDKGNQTPGLSPAVAKLVDAHMPPALTEATLAMASTSQDWKALANQSLSLYQAGYPVASQTLMASANFWRQKQGLPPFSFPPNAGQIAQATAATAVTPPPGMPPIEGIPPVQTSTTATKPPGIIDKAPTVSNPGPDGSVIVTLPNGQQINIPAGIMGTVTPGTVPTLPVPGPTTTPGKKVPGEIVPTPPAPTGVAPYKYPVGTHTRPDGTIGYTTQSGDYSTTVIAKKFGQASNADFLRANPGVAWTKNYAGTDLNVPASWLPGPGYAGPPPGPRGPNPPGGTSGGEKKAGSPAYA